MDWNEGQELEDQRVIPYERTDWTIESGGGWEHRVHFGESDDGHYYAPEYSYLGGEYGSGEISWRGPYGSYDEANQAAHKEIAQFISGDTEHSNGISL